MLLAHRVVYNKILLNKIEYRSVSVRILFILFIR